MDKVTDGGLLALADAGVGPGLEHLEFYGESADVQFNSECFSLVVYTSSPFQFGVDRSVDFRVYLLASKWVRGYQVAVLPEGVVFCCLWASVLILRLVVCGRVWCTRVTELGVLCALCMLGVDELGLLFSVDGENHCLMNVMCVVVCDAQT